MKQSFSLLVFLFCVYFCCEAQQQLISVQLQNKRFNDLVALVEKQTGNRVYFDPQWTDSFSITVDAQQQSVKDIMRKALEGTALHVAMGVNGDIYITKDRQLLTELPPGFIERKTERIASSSSFDYSDYEKREKQRRTAETKLYFIGNKSAPPTGNATLGGSVRDAASGEAVIGASLYIEQLKIGATTDQYGHYAITLPKGKHTIRVRSISMKNTQRSIMLYSDGKLDIELEPDVTPLKEVVVESEKDVRINSVQMGLEKLDIQTMKQIPLALGETDVMKVVLALPGVQSVGEGTVGLNVRGGATNQNLILLNDAVIYNPSHLFGFFSTFNPDVLKNVELYKSGIKAEYGGRISSVLEVHTRDGNLKKISGSGGISPVTGRFSIEGPLIKNKTSFIVGARSTYSNWILRKLNDPQLNRSRANFYDITANVTHHIDADNQVYLSLYNSHDDFNLANDTVYTYADRNGSLKWKHIFSNKLYGVLTGSFSRYGFEMQSDRNPANAFNMSFNIRQWNGKIDLSYFYSQKHTFDAGVSIIGYRLTPGVMKPVHAESLIASQAVQREYGREAAIYMGDNFEITPKILLYAGVRYSFYQYLGPKDTYRYSEGVPRQATAIADTVRYGAGKPIACYGGFEPRISVRFSTSERSSIKISYNRLRQNLQMLSNTTAIMPTDIWKLSDQHVQPQIGDQVSFGYYKNIKGNSVETSVETYYKVMRNTVDYKNGATLLLNHHIETDVVNSHGKAYGIELMVKKSSGKLNGWVSYAFSRSFLKTESEFLHESVNRGTYYAANYDKPHAVNFIGNYKFSRRFNFSLNLIYSTGRPITLPLTKFELGGATRVHYSDRNTYRIPDYFRTDISMNIEGNHKVKKLAHSSWTLAVYNLTGRKNAYSVFFTSENGVVKSYKLSVFARPIPTITYNFKF